MKQVAVLFLKYTYTPVVLRVHLLLPCVFCAVDPMIDANCGLIDIILITVLFKS